MRWSVPMAFTAPDALDPMVRWSLENTITTVIIIDPITVGSTALLAYTVLVALVLMVQRSSADLINPTINHRRDRIRGCLLSNARAKHRPHRRLARWNDLAIIG